MREKLKNPFTLIIAITVISFIPFIALLFDRLLLKLSYSVLFYIEIFAAIIFIFAGFLFAYLFIKK